MTSSNKKLVDVWQDKKFPEKLGYAEQAWFDQVLEIAERSNTVLEIGVGDGRMIRLLRQSKNINGKFFSVDLTHLLKQAHGHRSIGDTRFLPFCDNTFDLVYSLGVVEHFPQTQKAVLEHARVAKPGGYVFMTTPKLGLATPLKYALYLLKGEHKQGTFEIVRGRNLKLSTVREYCSAANLKIIKLAASSGKYGKQVDWILPPFLAGQYLYCLAKKSGSLHS